jgi:FAD/FMN-containing dehydrogenase
VTLGGAVANDVHGKNHHGAGTFGCHVLGLGLQRSTGECLELSPDRNAEMFAATIGGLGLTGIITWVELRLVPIVASDFEVEVLRFDHLDAFFPLAAASADWPYTVAWVDCLAQGARLGRGLFSRGRPAAQGPLTVHRLGQRINVPVDAPAGLLGPSSVRAFNAVYARQPVPEGPVRVDYDKFLYPLDGIGQWNRLYGPRGFYQHQSCVPLEAAPRILARLLELTSEAGQGSFLVVLKLFGPRPSPGLLSFPREGATFALDLPHAGAATLALLNRMADIVLDAGGRLYPAKDATMAPWHFQEAYPQWRQLEELRDPGLKSDFWRRVTRKAA